MIYNTTIRTDSGPVYFEFDNTFGNKAIVALNATLDDFRAKPCTLPGGGEGVEYAPKTIKDCTNIDGCVYLHLGTVPDTEMVRLINMFQKALKDRRLWKAKAPQLYVPKHQ